MSLLQEMETLGLADCEFNRQLTGDQTMKQIETYTNEAYGIESRIFETDRGFTVALHDLDADETLNHYYRFTSLAQAVVKAKHLANLN
jgi:hypothetical protein